MKIDVLSDDRTADDGRPMWAHKVFLDGVERKDAFAADEEAGSVSVYVTEPPLTENDDISELSNRVIIDNGKLKTTTLHGNVKIVALEQGSEWSTTNN